MKQETETQVIVHIAKTLRRVPKQTDVLRDIAEQSYIQCALVQVREDAYLIIMLHTDVAPGRMKQSTYIKHVINKRGFDSHELVSLIEHVACYRFL